MIRKQTLNTKKYSILHVPITLHATCINTLYTTDFIPLIVEFLAALGHTGHLLRQAP